jgi:hypothetical protein
MIAGQIFAWRALTTGLHAVADHRESGRPRAQEAPRLRDLRSFAGRKGMVG